MNKLTKSILILAGAIALTGCGQIHPTGYQKLPQVKQEVKNKIFAYTACRSAIKFWNKLSLFEINKLLNDAVLDYSATCPHWRPVIFEIDLEDLKGKYER